MFYYFINMFFTSIHFKNWNLEKYKLMNGIDFCIRYEIWQAILQYYKCYSALTCIVSLLPSVLYCICDVSGTSIVQKIICLSYFWLCRSKRTSFLPKTINQRQIGRVRHFRHQHVNYHKIHWFGRYDWQLSGKTNQLNCNQM